MEKKPDRWKCNACGAEGATSREHLFHIAIGRVIVADKGLTPDQVRTRLQDAYHRDFRLYKLGGSPIADEEEGAAWFNQAIEGLICMGCNKRWAKELEEQAGENLYDFTNLHGRADARLLRRWAFFFATKLWWGHRRTEPLAGGLLLPFLGKLVDPAVRIDMPVRLARLTSSPRDWSFAGIMRGWAGTKSPYIMWIMRGVVWMVVAKSPHQISLPVRTTELVDGLTLPQVPAIRRRELVPLFKAPPWPPGSRD